MCTQRLWQRLGYSGRPPVQVSEPVITGTLNDLEYFLGIELCYHADLRRVQLNLNEIPHAKRDPCVPADAVRRLSGNVPVETIVERAARSGGARTTYIGLAAEAAFLRGDMLGTVRLLRESIAHANEWCTAIPHVFFIRERASPEQIDLLDRAGIPRV